MSHDTSNEPVQRLQGPRPRVYRKVIRVACSECKSGKDHYEIGEALLQCADCGCVQGCIIIEEGGPSPIDVLAPYHLFEVRVAHPSGRLVHLRSKSLPSYDDVVAEFTRVCGHAVACGFSIGTLDGPTRSYRPKAILKALRPFEDKAWMLVDGRAPVEEALNKAASES